MKILREHQIESIIDGNPNYYCYTIDDGADVAVSGSHSDGNSGKPKSK